MIKPAVMVSQFCGEMSYSISRIRYVMNAVRTSKQNWSCEPRLVAVSKKHPMSKVSLAFQCGIRHFGENYVQELHHKANALSDEEHTGIKWHLVGHLQCNKVKLLTGIPNLWMVETVDRVKVATMLERHWAVNDKACSPLKVLVQVNTSGEENKSGCPLSNCVELAAYIHQNCPHLQFCGLMTVGRERDNVLKYPNPDFVSLVQCGSVVKDTLQIPSIELSMGMSNDYAHAIEMGSTNVRIGTAVFGSRPEGTEESGIASQSL